jgi:HPt (histidine-containing phosphotransfer) domain-containing protein
MELDKKKAMDELGVDEETFNELLKSFFSDADAEIEKLRAAIENDNFEEIARIGHTLKGMAGNYRITPIESIGKSIEQCAKESKDKQTIIDNLKAMEEGIEELKKSM